MNAQTLSIVVGSVCNANCKFCISKCTYNPGDQEQASRRTLLALDKTLRYAVMHGVDTLILTSKGEPLLDLDTVKLYAQKARDAGIPIIEVQTNGKVLSNAEDADQILHSLSLSGVTGLSVSIAGETPLRSSDVMQTSLIDFWRVGELVMQQGLLFRLSVVINSEGFPDTASVQRFLTAAQKHGVHQVTLRAMGVPHVESDDPRAQAVIDWVQTHQNSKALEDTREELETQGIFLRELPWGNARVYDYQGMSVCITNCLPQTGSEEDTWRSIILQPDGHVYHSWEYRGSILF